MEFIQYLSNNQSFWKYYSIISAIISFLTAAANFPRFLNEFKKSNPNNLNTFYSEIGNAIRFTIYDALQILFGFYMLFVNIQLLNFLLHTSSKTSLAILGVIFIISLFYSIFCVSGRGIEVMNKIIIDPGIKIIHIGLKGISIQIGKDKKE